jgi:hypothetical protein
MPIIEVEHLQTGIINVIRFSEEAGIWIRGHFGCA